MARALESTLKYWLKSFSRDQFKYKRRCFAFACNPWIAACYIRNHGESREVGNHGMYKSMNPRFRHHYEIQRFKNMNPKLSLSGSPCHLYSDLEFNIKENAEKNGDEMVDLLILIAFEALFDKYSIEGDTNSVVELGSSTNDKFSCHLIIRGYQGLLSKTTHILVHLLMRYVRGYTMEEEGIKDLKVCLFQKIQIQAVLMSLATFLLALLFIQETVVFVSIYHHKQGKVQCFFPLDGLNYNSHVLSILKSSTSQVQTALKGSGGSKTGVSEGVEASIIYVRFKAAASELKPVLEEIERRSSRKEYVQILSECHRVYCEQRLSLLEHQQFDHFFPSTSEDISSLAPLVDPL
ncbi:hypothetical protein LXL04_033705 [Taraxacum kok-saghyz]